MARSPSRKKAIKAALELKLRRAKGTRLQEFLALLMTKVHGDNFQSVGTDYSRGDLQCDGLLDSPLTIFACYGPVNAGASATEASMRTAVAKVESDFLGAKKEWPNLKGWKFVHNYVEPPAQIVQKILGLRNQHPGIDMSLFGREQFEATLFSLDDAAIEELVGDAASDEDFRALQPDVLLKVVDTLLANDSASVPTDDEPVKVPAQKLRFNGLSDHAQGRIVQGLQNADWVSKLLQDHQDPLFEGAVAAVLNDKYFDLKAQSLDPDDIMFQLWEFVANTTALTAALDAVIWSLLAHFFEKCTIFEDSPVAEAVA
ncbi:ABC-three component system protein [Pararhodobacter zhoushanensis]|uniref:ABC-three component system protein n=1 Tax=Pararhodobacter zhoushanensis TaxID=2479545 RepID=UPI0013E0081A|nr:ABC-three component system protein [Pararhodobacter zhoushanensis]